MLKLLHDASHNMSSLVICFKSVKSTLILFKSEADVFVGIPIREQYFHYRWVFPPGPGTCSPPAKHDFCQRVLPSYSEPCCPVPRGAKKEGSQKKKWILIFLIHGANQGFVCLLLSPGWGERVVVGEAATWVLGAIPASSLGLDALENLWVAEHCPQTATPMQWTCLLWTWLKWCWHG